MEESNNTIKTHKHVVLCNFHSIVITLRLFQTILVQHLSRVKKKNNTEVFPAAFLFHTRLHNHHLLLTETIYWSSLFPNTNKQQTTTSCSRLSSSSSSSGWRAAVEDNSTLTPAESNITCQTWLPLTPSPTTPTPSVPFWWSTPWRDASWEKSAWRRWEEECRQWRPSKEGRG